MIFVVLGTQKFQFYRLLKTIDRLIKDGLIKEKVIVQKGHTEYNTKFFFAEDFMEREEFESNIKQCSLLITHSGVGTIMVGINARKPVIVVPRLKRFGEHVDDHQIEIANAFVNNNFVLSCEEISDLANKIVEGKVHKFNQYVSKREEVIYRINEYLKES